MTNEIDDRLFEQFLRSASEGDLEEMMTTYMKTNRHSAIHLGVNQKSNKTNRNLHQESDVGPDEQAQIIETKQISEEKIITLTTEESTQKWALNDKQHRFERATSASRHRIHKRHEDIYRLYGVSRPLSAVVQHRKPIGSTSVASTKFSVRDRPNSATNEQIEKEKCPDENRDFVSQLNELSSKQHRRQYSGLYHLHAFHSRSPSVEQQTNFLLNTDSNNSQLNKQDEILEKSRQMLEESQIKNEQLAQQAKVFQRTFQRNEIYSALNRFAPRPPIYPTTGKESRPPSGRFHQLRIPTGSTVLSADQHRVKSTQE